jgi:hypothetical protein
MASPDMHQDALQAIAEGGLDVTGARLVSMAAYNDSSRRVRAIAWAARPRNWFDQGLDAARRIVPGYDPGDVQYEVKANQWVAQVHVEGKTVLTKFTNAAGGTTHPGVVKVGAMLMAIKYTLSVPIKNGDTIVGSLAFHFTSRPPDGIRQAAEAYVQSLTSSSAAF